MNKARLRVMATGLAAQLAGGCSAHALAAGPGSKSSAGAPGTAPSGPISLTTDDGAGLELVSLSGKAVIDDPLALTELHMTFRNPEARVREGRFRIALPQAASVSRFAMKIGGRWQEGEIVERHAARVAYEDALHRRVDPALLEHEAGNEFSARVFPIPAGADKEVVVTYSEELVQPAAPYRVSLRGLPRIGSLALSVVARTSAASPAVDGARTFSQEVVELRRSDWTPDRDFEVARPTSAARAALRAGALAVVRITPTIDAAEDPPESLAILVDTSASRGMGLAEDMRLVTALVSELRQRAGARFRRLDVLAFDQDVAPVFSGPPAGFGAAEAQRILDRGALGASDLSLALRTVAAQRPAPARVVVVSDGVATAGAREGSDLRGAAGALAAAGVRRCDAIGVGGIRDDETLRLLVARAGARRQGVVAPAGREARAADAAGIAGRLLRRALDPSAVTVEGATWSWPAEIAGLQGGDAALVYAELPEGAPLRVTLGGVPVALGGEVAPIHGTLLDRSAARARIARLSAQRDATPLADRDVREALRHEIVTLSTRHRVLSPFTAMVVLESDFDYARAGIRRQAEDDILRVRGTGGDRDDGAYAVVQERDNTGTHIKETFDEEFIDPIPLGRGYPDVADLAAGVVDSPSAKSSHPNVESAPAGVTDDGPAQPRSPGGVTFNNSYTVDGVDTTDPAVHTYGMNFSADAMANAQRARNAATPNRSAAAPYLSAAAPDRPVAAPTPRERFHDVMALVGKKRGRRALAAARQWQAEAPGAPLALVALGEALELDGDRVTAARAYGSLIDLFPSRADMRRYAAERLLRIASPAALALALDTLRVAAADRPDHPSGPHLLGLALLRAGRAHEAFDVFVAALGRRLDDTRFAGVGRILREDAGLAAAAWTRAEPAQAAAIAAALRSAGGSVPEGASLRFVLSWETDANDVDLHVEDAEGHHAFFAQPTLPDGGELYADVTTGYGPECFAIPLASGPVPRARAPYRLRVHYFNRGAMGFGLGTVQIVGHDGQGALTFEDRPFAILEDHGEADLGLVAVPPAHARR